MTRIIYPYNEILPRKKAHDAYVFHSCAAFKEAGVKAQLLCGRGSCGLSEHYGVAADVIELPIVRKNNFLNLSWNLPFFYASQRVIEREKPDFVLMSVFKQGAYHLERKVPGVKYVYEVHELSDRDHEMLARADLIVVTTEQLKKMLQVKLDVPIEVIPLAVHAKPLPEKVKGEIFELYYVGATYREQGLELLLEAMERVRGVRLTIIGGSVATSNANVRCLGFHPPAVLQELVKEADCFVAPFLSVGRMPYVAHTKLYEYAHWGRPIIAPDLPIVHEHVEAVMFEPDSAVALAAAIERAKSVSVLPKVEYTWHNRTTKYLRVLESL